MIDYELVSSLVVDIVKSALPIGIVFTLAERLVNIFLSFAFPKTFKGGL